jgi:uncharacterized membrane protein
MLILLGLILSLIGLCIATYIHAKQGAKKPLMCPRKAPCETVLSSSEATTFGFSNALLGMVYYAGIVLLYTFFFTAPQSEPLGVLLVGLSTFGFLFSLYLIGVQQFKIKQWCVWCLGSAFIATSLFVVSLLLVR